MKKLTALTLVLVLILALGVTAFADNFGITITKSPTDEVRSAGGTAWFVSGATNYNTLDWTFVAPSGRQFTVQEFRKMFPYVTVDCENTTNLTVRNLSTDLNGWAVFCNFHSANDNASTNWAFFYVSATPSYSTNPSYTPPTGTAPTYTTPADTSPVPYGVYDGGYTYDAYGNLEHDVYYGDGHYTTYYADGSSYTSFPDGRYVSESADGSYVSYDNGSWFQWSPDGTWNSYDAVTDTYSGGVNYD